MLLKLFFVLLLRQVFNMNNPDFASILARKDSIGFILPLMTTANNLFSRVG